MKKTQLRTINIPPSILPPPVTFTFIFLEYQGEQNLAGIRNAFVVDIHIAVSLALAILCGLHIKAHFENIQLWLKRLNSSKIPNRVLFWIFIATLLTGLTAIATWIRHGHSIAGAIHGKSNSVTGRVLLHKQAY